MVGEDRSWSFKISIPVLEEGMNDIFTKNPDSDIVPWFMLPLISLMSKATLSLKYNTNESLMMSSVLYLMLISQELGSSCKILIFQNLLFQHSKLDHIVFITRMIGFSM